MTRQRKRSNASHHPPVAISSAAQQRLDTQHQLSDIQRALQATPVDTAHLRAISHRSFLTTAFRQQIWPLLLSLPASSPSTYPVIHQHAYYAQVEKDIARSLHHFDVCQHWKTAHRDSERRKLAGMIHSVLSLHPQLHYIQGYHDIASVLLLTLQDDRRAFLALERLSLMHIKDSLQPTLNTVISALSLIFPLLRLVDPALHALLAASSVQSFFTLSWVLTWFSHNLTTFTVVCHYFDFFLSSHPAMPIYMVVALILSQRSQLVALAAAAAPEPLEASAVHTLFQSLDVRADADCTAMCAQAEAMYERYPPAVLCRMTETPPESSARVRVQSPDDLVRRAQEDEQQEERERRRRGRKGWLDWARQVGATWTGKDRPALADWGGWLGVAVVVLAAGVGAYRLLLLRQAS